MTASHPQEMEFEHGKVAPQEEVEVGNEDWEEWDGRSPFWIHCVAGSLAGVVEHTAVYPLDTVRTHIQVCASCVQRTAALAASHTLQTGATATAGTKLTGGTDKTSLRGSRGLVAPPRTSTLPTGMWQTIRFLMNESAAAAAAADVAAIPAGAPAVAPAAPSSSAALVNSISSMWQGWTRLWRGVPSVMIGCVPAHALYFSSYEIVKNATLNEAGEVTTYGSSLAGAAAVCGHDVIMTPMDTIKQRMQLGHYEGVSSALIKIIQTEGWRSLFRSFPITLASNIPYGMIMVSTNEFCKQAWTEEGSKQTWQTIVASSSIAGFAASALTTPLDRIKTALQTQELAPACVGKESGCKVDQFVVRHATWKDATMVIWRQEGAIGFFRGMTPRVLSHVPAVAISWTAYETAKQALMERYEY